MLLSFPSKIELETLSSCKYPSVKFMLFGSPTGYFNHTFNMGPGKVENDSIRVENDGGNAMPSPILLTTGNSSQSHDPKSQSSTLLALQRLIEVYLRIL